MAISLELPPDLEARLREEADRQHLPLEGYALSILRGCFPSPRSVPLSRTATPEEWKRITHEFLEAHRGWPVLPDEAFSRESIYEGRY
jgi:hypothetical protein